MDSNTRPLLIDDLKGQEGIAFIDRKKLLSIIALSERTILEKERRGEFPKRFSITSRRVVWDMREITVWMNAQKIAGVQAAVPCVSQAETDGVMKPVQKTRN